VPRGCLAITDALASPDAGSYEVLARRTRPQTFSEVIGQEHVTRTLVNAITSGRVAHAFVFSGMRGVGKTTTARILAKALNCEQGPTADPCNRCGSCVEITEGRSLDVLEVDAASQTGIDATRELLETVKYHPASARFRIYIIDEAHGLSKQAVDAFLKTLEEPPPHAKFILATTAAHKLTATILSRCQRFDFRAVPLETIADALGAIVKREGMTSDAAALMAIAREAGGSLRDATSLLDQVLAFADGAVDLPSVEAALGLPDERAVREIVDATCARDPARALAVIAAVSRQGTELVRFAHEILERLRNLAVLAVAGEAALSDLSARQIADLKECASAVSVEDLQRFFKVLLDASEELARTTHPRLVLEMTVVQMATLPPLVPIDELLGRLERLEKRGGGAGAAGPSRPSAAPSAAANPPPTTARASFAPRRPAESTNEPRGSTASTAAPPPATSSPAPEPVRSMAAGAEPASAPEQPRWKALVGRLQRERASRFFRLSYSRLLEITEDEIRVAVAGREAADARREDETRRAIERAVEEEFGRRLRFVCVLPDEGEPQPQSRPAQASLDREAREDPVVKLSMEVLEGRVEAVVPRTRHEA
jgi:DNA polymerase-3 subunit gamma/tau